MPITSDFLIKNMDAYYRDMYLLNLMRMVNKPTQETKEMSEAKEVAVKNRFENVKVDVEREGTKIVLPSNPFPMNYDEAINCLTRRKLEEETEVSINEVIDSFPYDGAYAFMKAMQRVYGWASPVPTETFFGPMPPKTINLEISHNVFTQIIWGNFKVPGIDGVLSTGWAEKDGRYVFKIGGTVKKKHQADILHLASVTREILKRESVYKGQAIQLVTDEAGDLDLNTPPKFLDLSGVNPEELVFSDDVAEQVETSLFTPIEHTQACREAQIPLKRGVLLEGPFGTGKTLTAFVAATKCAKNNWTFILIKRVDALKEALTFARLYQPAVVFAEDVDRAVTGDRSVAMDDILNTIDGVESKGSEVMTVLTSNDVTSINRAMLRPGRLDAVIPIHAPDAVAVQKLIKLYARSKLAENADLTEAGEVLRGNIPATIREVVERSKLYAIGRTGTTDFKLTGDDLAKAARGMKNHLQLLNPPSDAPKTPTQLLGEAFVDVLADAQKSNGLYDRVKNTEANVEHIKGRLS